MIQISLTNTGILEEIVKLILEEEDQNEKMEYMIM